ncbi:MAG: hypothetical protein KDB07_13790, partial [Planctomycetes bacterium]|nr:hypothetical protein [Planctomycetota bacterium]
MQTLLEGFAFGGMVAIAAGLVLMAIAIFDWNSYVDGFFWNHESMLLKRLFGPQGRRVFQGMAGTALIIAGAAL